MPYSLAEPAKPRYHAIPTNIITGFLGVGKTTAIQYLLTTKPSAERWAVLVNEFGEIGIDGALLAATSSAFIKEVPGGCLCCAASVPLQVALNQLIRQAQPDRLLIEPTGLGHPHEVIATLTHPPYATALDLRATLTLVDARHLQDPRYTEHQIFRQQLQVADVVIAHKADQSDATTLAQLNPHLTEMGLINTPWYPVTQGQLNPAWLDMPRQAAFDFGHYHPPHADAEDAEIGEIALPTCGYVRKEHTGAGFVSQGWLFAARYVFAYAKLHRLFSGVPTMRLKAVVMTEQGAMAFNRIDDHLTAMNLSQPLSDSRIELIHRDASGWAGLEAQLLACRSS